MTPTPSPTPTGIDGNPADHALFPHGMRYILIDKVERVDYARRLRALKTVSRSEDYFTDHFPGAPIMPGALLIESMAQAGTALLELSEDLAVKALLVMVERAKFRALVRPGDNLVIDVALDSRDGSWARVNGTVRANGRTVADADLTFSINDVNAFYPEVFRSMIRMAYADLTRDAVIGPFADDS